MTFLFMLAGFVVGTVFGWTAKSAVTIYREEHPVPVSSEHNRPWVVGFFRGLLVVALVGNFFMAILMVQQRSVAEDFTRCTANWQEAFYNAYSARSSANAATSEATDGIVLAVGDDDPDTLQMAIERYLAVREQQRQERQENPLPPLPTKVCGR